MSSLQIILLDVVVVVVVVVHASSEGSISEVVVLRHVLFYPREFGFRVLVPKKTISTAKERETMRVIE